MNIKINFIILLVIFLFVGCSNDLEIMESNDNSNLTVLKDKEIFIDSQGKRVFLKKDVKKIISLSPTGSDIICSLDAKNLIVGRTSEGLDYNELVGITNVGSLNKFSIKRIKALDPDAILIGSDVSEIQRNKLIKTGIPTVLIYKEKNINELFFAIELIGKITNERILATEKILSLEEKLNNIKNKLNDEEKKKILYISHLNDENELILDESSFIKNLIDQISITEDKKLKEEGKISIEELKELNPDVILFKENTKVENFLKRNYILRNINAIKEKNLYAINDKIISYNTNFIDGLNRLYELIYESKLQ